MISARSEPAFDSLIAQLVAKARALAQAQAEAASLTQPDDPARWRTASLVWPVFTKG